MRRIVLITLTVVCLWVSRVQAQTPGLPVFDATNLLQNTVQALQAVYMVANQVLELTGLDVLVLGDEFASDLDELTVIMREARGLSYDISSLQAQVTVLFHLDMAPRSATELQLRLREIRRVV